MRTNSPVMLLDAGDARKHTNCAMSSAVEATFIGQAIGHYGPDQGAGFITATIGALVVLFIWNRLVASRVISDPGNR